MITATAVSAVTVLRRAREVVAAVRLRLRLLCRLTEWVDLVQCPVKRDPADPARLHRIQPSIAEFLSQASFASSAHAPFSGQYQAPQSVKPLSSTSSFYNRATTMSSPTPSPAPTVTGASQDGAEFSRYHELYEEEEAPFANLSLENKLKIVIVGSGFGGWPPLQRRFALTVLEAGLSAAIACARQGFSVTLLEKGVGVSPHGDNISLGSNAVKLLCRWGCLDDLWKHACKGGWWVIKDQDGEVVRVEDLRDL